MVTPLKWGDFGQIWTFFFKINFNILFLKLW